MNCDICKTLCLRPEEHGLCGLWLPGWFARTTNRRPTTTRCLSGSARAWNNRSVNHQPCGGYAMGDFACFIAHRLKGTSLSPDALIRNLRRQVKDVPRL